MTADPADGKPRVAPRPLDEVLSAIASEKPAFVCMPHVETSVGLIAPDDYVAAVGKATRDVGGIFCLDGIASGNCWIDMEAMDIDCYITAPQKGWSAPAACGVVMLGPRAEEKLASTTSTSFSVDLAKWASVMDAYESGGFMYHSTPPTDAMCSFDDAIKESLAFGLDALEANTWSLGTGVRASLSSAGFPSVVADEAFQSPTVVVVHSDSNEMVGKFKAQGLQIAAGVPWMIGQGSPCPSCTSECLQWGSNRASLRQHFSPRAFWTRQAWRC